MTLTQIQNLKEEVNRLKDICLDQQKTIRELRDSDADLRYKLQQATNVIEGMLCKIN